MSENQEEQEEQGKSYEAEIFDPTLLDENNFEEVLELTNYTDSELSGKADTFVVAEYDNINIVETTVNQQKIAKKFVQETKRLIKSYTNDNIISKEANNYLDSIANLQVTQLGDLLSMVSINKQMLDNMVRRVNSVQAEDYALVQTYTNLLQQHLKLHRELQISYSAIPGLMKKMLMDINTDLLDDNTPKTPIISEKYGVSQFNDSKELLKKLKEESSK